MCEIEFLIKDIDEKIKEGFVEENFLDNLIQDNMNDEDLKYMTDNIYYDLRQILLNHLKKYQ